MALIELGLIDGNFFNADHVNTIEAAINSGIPAGKIDMYIGTVAPTGWLMLNGQVVVNAQGLFPDLWLVAPVAWRSGASLNLPNMASRLPIGQDGTHANGTVGGSNTKAIAEANLPVHHHAYNGTTGIQNARHTHYPGNYFAGDQFVIQRFGGPNAIQITPGTGATITSYPGTSDELGSLSGGDGNHGHVFSGNTTDIGSGAALDITPAWLAINFILKAH